MLSFVAVLILSLGVLAGCGAGGQEGEDRAFITATPNTVPAGEDPRGTTTISWGMGEGGSWGQIYVSEKGKPEKLFAEGASGSQEAPWIAQGKEYEFRLYAGKERKTLLDSVKVTRSEEDSPAAVSDQEAQSMSDEAFIKASPNPVATRGESGKTTISWDTDGKASWGQVYVSEKGKPEKLFAEGASGSQEAPWIAEGKEYKFRLYAGTERATLLDKVTVTRGVVEATTEGTTTKESTGGVVGGVVPVQNGWSVSVQDFSFYPADAAVEPGFTLTWINEGNESHTVTAEDGTFDSGVLTPGDSFTVAFEERATLTYHCEIHPSMVGSVTVG